MNTDSVIDINNVDELSSTKDPWRNGSASDSRSEGCVFDSRRVQAPEHYPDFFFLPPVLSFTFPAFNPFHSLGLVI